MNEKKPHYAKTEASDQTYQVFFNQELILESNHDLEMLANGPYPWPLKQRIKSRTGHLSNVDSKNLLQELQHDRLEHVILAHLSETNNTPQKAYEEAAKVLARSKTRLTVAEQGVCGPILYLK